MSNLNEKGSVIEVATMAKKNSNRLSFNSEEWLPLVMMYGTIILLHVAGWGLYLYYSRHYPALIGLGLVAYLFGLRHAFDIDHISAIDDTVRFMMQKNKKPLSVGFFFSLGHSSIVFGLAIAIIFAAAAVKDKIPFLEDFGGLIGAGVSGSFLWFVGILNLLVLLDILKVWRRTKTGKHNHAHLEELLSQRGFINRLFGGRLQKLISSSWHMYPVGFLFGLGFDTASEVGLLAMTAGASAGNLPWQAVLCLPVLFTAGMTLMDTTDGVIMCKAYDWAFINPLRKIFYNMTTTALSTAVALLIGTVEILQVLAHLFSLNTPFFNFFAGLDFNYLGYIIVGLFILAWGISVGIWKFGNLEEKYSVHIHAHPHSHEDGTIHSHPHLHLKNPGKHEKPG